MGEYFRTEQAIKRKRMHIEEYQGQIHLLNAEKIKIEMRYDNEEITYEQMETSIHDIDEQIAGIEQWIEDMHIEIGECEGYLAELDYIDNGNAYGW